MGNRDHLAARFLEPHEPEKVSLDLKPTGEDDSDAVFTDHTAEHRILAAPKRVVSD